MKYNNNLLLITIFASLCVAMYGIYINEPKQIVFFTALAFIFAICLTIIDRNETKIQR